jgi:hypothetical protein
MRNKNLFKIYDSTGNTILARLATMPEVRKYLDNQSKNIDFMVEDVVNGETSHSSALWSKWNNREEFEDLKNF